MPEKWNRERTSCLLRYGRKQSGPWDWLERDDPEWREGDIPDDRDVDLIINAPAMLSAIEGALRISSLWLPPENVAPENQDEASALIEMKRRFEQIVKSASRNAE